MNNNDIFRRLQNILNLDTVKMMEVFSFTNLKADKDQINSWLKNVDDPGYLKIGDHHLTPFLNGLIDYKRGKKEDSVPGVAKRLNNNIIFTKLKIAFNLKADDILEIMSLADFPIRKLELSAFFRKPENKHYRECKDDVLERFFRGLEKHYCSKS